MAASLFITGCRGFIGQHLLQALEDSKYEKIYCLSSTGPDAADQNPSGKFQWIKAALHQPEVYAPYLVSGDSVVHLAAVTGKAKPEGYFTINCQGTKSLLEQCKRAGVTKFLYVSSIAVKFPEKSHYYYAQSKDEAERLVRDSGLNYTIIRPTIVLGKESPVWKKLCQIAKAPVIPVFGSGTARIQPIYVDDLVNWMVSFLSESLFLKETLEVGGPEIIAIEEFLQRIHEKYRKQRAPVVHLPVKQLIPVLNFVERYASSLLPFNSGQLSSFLYDGIAEPNGRVQHSQHAMKNVQTMLAVLTDRS